MIIDDQQYDLIIIGTGAGGGTLAYQLAPTGKKILILERGTYLPREKANWSATEVYAKERYHTNETWYDIGGEPFRPQMSYWVGGNTKVYGAALIRLRERDFDEVNHQQGVSPAWALKYTDFEPYYAQAEKLYEVHGRQGDDPIEPPRSGDYPHPPVSHEPRIQQIAEAITKQGLRPFHLPLGIRLNEVDRTISTCIRCDSCDGFPCLVHAKSDAETGGIRPALQYPNVTLKTEAKVLRLHTSESGREIKAVEVEMGGETYLFHSNLVVVACGAINSAALLLRSHNDKHPNGLANRSDQVGRNFMKHLTTALVQISEVPNPDTYQKTICVNDFYWGDNQFPYPMGQVQNTGNVLPDMIPAEAPPLLAPFAKLVPQFGLQRIASHTTGWWLQSEDLPDPNNRVRMKGEKLHLEYTPNNSDAHERLIYTWVNVLKSIDKRSETARIPHGIYPRNSTGIQVMAHQCGTCRFGEDPTTSVLDLNCRTHDVDNLYVVDSSFFPSNSGVNPTLTIIANALRVGEHLAERMK
ncbi:GMC family oxidoreductase [Kovacikia minuta CCNUW1]|uniref:GMC oxidoreductase n=1 Tax=Kovacikia minuta TaxID=2931930 RepID=UPI001CC9EC9A|nr:GMC family oxidoreductase [Kovacikia minuta]UBF29321.1 GMC family oxidoreductase [Kovacikia minuta CCNUW1]